MTVIVTVDGLLTAPVLSVTVRLNVRVVDTCAAMNTGLTVLGNTRTPFPVVQQDSILGFQRWDLSSFLYGT